MKINEMPEKIYLSYETDDEDYKDHIFIDYMWHKHPFEGKNLKNVEYIRKDVFIRRARKYFIKELPNFRSFMESGTAFIKNFESFIQGE